MTSTKTRNSKRDSDLYSFDQFIVKVHRSAAGTAWRWRTELLTLGGLLAALYWLSRQITIIWAAVVLAAAIGIIFAVPWSRRFITRRFWCVLARHRFHRLCWEARLHTRAGRLPVVLWTRPTKVGERLTVWCRAGICRRGLRAAHRRTAGRLLRPRRAGHPQHVLVPAGDHRHHPPRHPRGQASGRLPADPAVGRLRRRAGQPARRDTRHS